MPNNVWGGFQAMVPCLPGRPARDGGWPAQPGMGSRPLGGVESQGFMGSERNTSVGLPPAAAPSRRPSYGRKLKREGGLSPHPQNHGMQALSGVRATITRGFRDAKSAPGAQMDGQGQIQEPMKSWAKTGQTERKPVVFRRIWTRGPGSGGQD